MNEMGKVILNILTIKSLSDDPPILFLCIVQSEDVIQHIKASLWCWHQMEHLAKLKSVLFTGELKITRNKDKHTAGRTRRLAINGGDAMLTLLKRQRSEFSDDVLRALDLLPFKSEHGSFLVKIG